MKTDSPQRLCKAEGSQQRVHKALQCGIAVTLVGPMVLVGGHYLPSGAALLTAGATLGRLQCQPSAREALNDREKAQVPGQAAHFHTGSFSVQLNQVEAEPEFILQLNLRG